MKRLLPFLLATTNLTAIAQNAALDFDGLDDLVSVPNGSGLIAGASGFSIACWVYPRNAAPAFPDFDGFTGFRNESDCDFYMVQISPANTVEGRVRLSDFTSYTVNSDGLVLNTWNHFALTYDGAELTMYQNGAEVANIATSAAGISNGTVPFEAGNVQFGFTQFLLNGRLDEIGLWSRALNADEVFCLANGPIQANSPQLEVMFQCNEGVPFGDNSSLLNLSNGAGTENGDFLGFTLTGNGSNFVEGTPFGTTVEGSACPGGTFSYNGEEYSVGSYQLTLPGTALCDSLITLIVSETPINTAVSQNGTTLTCLNGSASWQWLDCNNAFSPIPGATFQTFTPAENGSYAVQVTQGDCTDISACYNVTSIGVAEIAAAHPLPLSPSITDGPIRATLPFHAGAVEMRIVDLRGRIASRVKLTAGLNELDMRGLEPGAYMAVVVMDGSVLSGRFVKY